MGAFVSLDLFLFYVFWEAMLIPMYLLIGIWGGPRRIYASVKFIIYTIVGSVLMLAAILYAGIQAGSFDVLKLQELLPRLPVAEQQILFLAFAISFAIKVPLFPFHTWLPDAHVEAPTAGSVILAGVLLKMGTYGFLRFAIPFFPDAARHYTTLIVALSAIGIVYGSLMAMAQSDIKKLVAYSSVAHLGFCMLGIFSGTLAGAQGGVLQMVNHGLSTGALFLLIGVIYEKTHRRGVDDFGGMAKIMPVYAVLFMIVTLSSIGLPGLNGFVGEFLVLFGSFKEHPKATVVASLGVVLGAVYMLKMYRDVFFGPVTRPEREKVGDVGKGELAYLLPIIALIVVLGIFPNLILSKTQPAVQRVVKTFNPESKVAVEHDR
jgi:NADH-quinone oxidoreductase subunit M